MRLFFIRILFLYMSCVKPDIPEPVCKATCRFRNTTCRLAEATGRNFFCNRLLFLQEPVVENSYSLLFFNIMIHR